MMMQSIFMTMGLFLAATLFSEISFGQNYYGYNPGLPASTQQPTGQIAPFNPIAPTEYTNNRPQYNQAQLDLIWAGEKARRAKQDYDLKKKYDKKKKDCKKARATRTYRGGRPQFANARAQAVCYSKVEKDRKKEKAKLNASRKIPYRPDAQTVAKRAIETAVVKAQWAKKKRACKDTKGFGRFFCEAIAKNGEKKALEKLAEKRREEDRKNAYLASKGYIDGNSLVARNYQPGSSCTISTHFKPDVRSVLAANPSLQDNSAALIEAVKTKSNVSRLGALSYEECNKRAAAVSQCPSAEGRGNYSVVVRYLPNANSVAHTGHIPSVNKVCENGVAVMHNPTPINVQEPSRAPASAVEIAVPAHLQPSAESKVTTAVQ